MSKERREKAEKLLYDNYIKSNPKIKKLLTELSGEGDVELEDIIQPIIKERLDETRMIGVNIGFQSAFLICQDAIKDMDSIEEIKQYVENKAQEVRDKLGLKEED